MDTAEQVSQIDASVLESAAFEMSALSPLVSAAAAEVIRRLRAEIAGDAKQGVGGINRVSCFGGDRGSFFHDD